MGHSLVDLQAVIERMPLVVIFGHAEGQEMTLRHQLVGRIGIGQRLRLIVQQEGG